MSDQTRMAQTGDRRGAMVVRAVRVIVPTGEEMRRAGRAFSTLLRSQDVVLLSGPLGAGKTTFAQGIGEGLKTDRPVVSPTFTIARELDGTFADGSPAHLVHVDAYRIGGVMRLPGDDARDALLDELESLGLDEELDDPSEGTVVLMEWGEHMAGILSDERCEVRVRRSEGTQDPAIGTGTDGDERIDGDAGTDDDAAAGTDGDSDADGDVLSADGSRELLLSARGTAWQARLPLLAQAFRRAGLQADELTDLTDRGAGMDRDGTAPAPRISEDAGAGTADETEQRQNARTRGEAHE
jgi:tRNA threonylcarbamoyladenosine biosynthesis protein TsaE